MRNIEIKVALSEKGDVVNRLNALGAKYQYTMKQADYYFDIGENKDKLRIIDGREFQLISYQRKEKHGQKDSYYEIKELTAVEKDALLASRKAIKHVEKTRELWLYGNTRIHLDLVEQLGNFLELETVIKDISLKAGKNEFKTVVNGLGIDATNSVAASYSDLVPALA
ncbi:MAG: class IV adenylate cyclase [Eggerthellaceae bacterium]|nr:class IV adenylate cyclase [Eggerthellaceae bacterium]